MNGQEWPYIGNYASKLDLIMKDKDNTLSERNKTTFYGTLNLWRTCVSTDVEESLSHVQTCSYILVFLVGSGTAQHVQIRTSLQLIQIRVFVRCLMPIKAATVSSGRLGDSVSCEVVHLGILFLYLRAACHSVVSKTVSFCSPPSLSILCALPPQFLEEQLVWCFPQTQYTLAVFFNRFLKNHSFQVVRQDKRGSCSECFNRKEKGIQDIHKEIIIFKYSADDCILGFERI